MKIHPAQSVTLEALEFELKLIQHDIDARRELDRVINAAVQQRFDQVQANVTLAEASLDKRLNDMNQWREQLKAQTGAFITRDMYDAKHELLQGQVTDLTRRIEKTEALKQGSSNNWILIIGALSFLSAIMALLLNALRLFTSHQ